ncbi:MAG: hypothetical protein J5594_02855 [Elusimicrobiaceae bacterium]|nr:hypothetical protein [Elusimicrobiaceae bacterium]
MKKLSISFILLLGFLALIPQNVEADVAVYYTPREVHEMSRVKVNSLQCFYKIKSNTPTEYKGQNLALKRVPYSYDSGFSSFKYKPPVKPSYKYSTDARINGQDTCDLFSSGGFNPDKETGLMVPDKTCYDHTINNRQENTKYDVNSFVSDCREYVTVYSNGHRAFRSAYGYDVTDVPPGSYLKFIPETKEVQVISNKDESYKKDIPNKISVLNAEEKRLKGTTPANVNNDNFSGRESEIRIEHLANAKSLYCLYNKKSKLSQKYSGQDIKLESCDKYKQYSYKDHIYYPICGGYTDSYYGTRDVYDYFIYGDTVEELSFRYHLLTQGLSTQNKKAVNEIIMGNGKIGSLHGNCNEYIAITFLDVKSKKHITYFADVTNVPPNSYLQYVPETKTLKVISPADKNYADIAKKYREKQKENAKEEQLAKEYLKEHKNKLKERYDLQITFED